MNFEHLDVKKTTPYIAVITLFRPEVANAINAKLAEELTATMQSFSENSEIRCIIITGEGPKVFCSGADLKERKGMNKQQWQAQHHAFELMLQSVTSCPIPVIAAVNGAAYGGGLELAMACDFIIAANNARFALTEASLGIMPGLGGTLRLPRAIGSRMALQMLCTAKPLTAQQAMFYGLANDITEPADLMSLCLSIANELASNAPLAVRAIKKVVHQGLELTIEQATKLEMAEYNQLIETADRQEGINAFNEKRAPQFTGN